MRCVSRTIYYLHFYCYFCNLLALPTTLDSWPAPSAPLFVHHFYCHSVSVYFLFIFPFFFFGGQRESGAKLVENLLFALFDLLSWATEGALHFTLFALPVEHDERGRLSVASRERQRERE